MVRKAGSNARRVWLWAGGAGLVAATLFVASVDARSSRHKAPPEPAPVHHRPPPHSIHWPLEIPGVQYAPRAWSEIAGWGDDDQLAAFKTFRNSCTPILAQRTPPPDDKFLGTALREPCRAANKAKITGNAAARGFFEQHFVPVEISRLGEEAGFVTGYYEPVVDGSRTRTDVYNVPVYRRPSNLFVRGFNQASPSMPNKGEVFRKIGRRKLVPYYDRAAIEDGAIAGRGLEVVWLKSQTDLLFIQIQGSARIKLADGTIVRINYDAHNGYPYTPVGRILIERNIIPREQMSMQRIREYMEQNPGAADELRRQNKSYVFFREVALGEKDEPLGAQGVPLTPGRSIAVDKGLHLYGTPFYIDATLPIEGDASTTPFRRLMVAQDTGSAIIGPARADIYFGAGLEAGRIAGRIKNAARFALLLPKSVDPLARGRTVPLPDPRPSAAIAKRFPQKDAPKPDAIKPETTDKPATAKPATDAKDTSAKDSAKASSAKPSSDKPDQAAPAPPPADKAAPQPSNRGREAK